jgi:hypothetical protein
MEQKESELIHPGCVETFVAQEETSMGTYLCLAQEGLLFLTNVFLGVNNINALKVVIAYAKKAL